MSITDMNQADEQPKQDTQFDQYTAAMFDNASIIEFHMDYYDAANDDVIRVVDGRTATWDSTNETVTAELEKGDTQRDGDYYFEWVLGYDSTTSTDDATEVRTVPAVGFFELTVEDPTERTLQEASAPDRSVTNLSIEGTVDGGAAPPIELADNLEATTDTPRLRTSGSGTGEWQVYDAANVTPIARFEEGGDVTVAGGRLKMQNARFSGADDIFFSANTNRGRLVHGDEITVQLNGSDVLSTYAGGDIEIPIGSVQFDDRAVNETVSWNRATTNYLLLAETTETGVRTIGSLVGYRGEASSLVGVGQIDIQFGIGDAGDESLAASIEHCDRGNTISDVNFTTVTYNSTDYYALEITAENEHAQPHIAKFTGRHSSVADLQVVPAVDVTLVATHDIRSFSSVRHDLHNVAHYHGAVDLHGNQLREVGDIDGVSGDNLQLQTGGGGADEIKMYDAANNQTIAEFEEGGGTKIRTGHFFIQNRNHSFLAGDRDAVLDAGSENSGRYVMRGWYDSDTTTTVNPTSIDAHIQGVAQYNGGAGSIFIEVEADATRVAEFHDTGVTQFPSGRIEVIAGGPNNTGALEFANTRIYEDANGEIVAEDSAGNTTVLS